MTKKQFLEALQGRLSHLPQEEAQERLNFYSEMIDDRMEEGLSEEDAVAAVETVEEIAGDIPAPTKTGKKPKKTHNGWGIALLVLGSPIWVSLGVAACAALFAFVVSLWAVIVSLWAVFVSVAACAGGGVLGAVGLAFGGKNLTALAMLGVGIFAAGLSVLLFLGCRAATKGAWFCTKTLVRWISNNFFSSKGRA